MINRWYGVPHSLRHRLLVAVAWLGLLPAMAAAQLSTATAPTKAPRDVTGQCKDSSFTFAAIARGACASHGGIALWWGLAASASRRSVADIAPLAQDRESPAVDPKPSTKPERGVKGDSVWVNTRSSVYHCPGSRWYGATAQGRYSTERDAIASGARPAYGRACAADAASPAATLRPSSPPDQPSRRPNG